MKSPLGQFIITGISGTTLTEEESQFLQKENIGGVILFDRNYESPAQLAELINNIQTLRNEYPLFIAVDHEGGRVQRFKEHFTHFPSALELSRLDSPKLIFKAYQVMAEELSACGVNLNLAPCCDILTNPKNKVIGDRAFGEDEATVSKFVSSVIRGLQTTNVISCAKHFPGHGGTSKDSHFDLPIVKTTLSELESREILPFIKAVKSRTEMLMMAHLVVDAFDQDLPVSLSKKAHKYVREVLRFNKVIISDDMQMKAITEHFEVGKSAAMALEAGTDIVEYRDMDYAREALEGLKEAKKDGALKADMVNAKIKRVDTLKKTYLREYNPVYIPQLSKIFDARTHEVFLRDIREKLSEVSSS